MDKQLRALLDDPHEWDRVAKMLLLTARAQMQRCGLTNRDDRGDLNATWSTAFDFVMDAVTAAVHSFDSNRGDLIPHLKRLVTRGVIDKYKRLKTERKEWPELESTTARRSLLGKALSVRTIDDLGNLPEENEKECGILFIEFMMSADSELQGFLSAALSQLEYSGRNEVIWKDVAKSLGISKYRCNQLRAKVKTILERIDRTSV